MKILAIESSAKTAGAAISCDGVLVAEFNLSTGLTHSETLMPLVDSVLKMAKVDIEDIDAVAVSNGPGSFTGLRIGLGTAKGLAMGVGAKTVGVSTLLALAHNILPTDSIILPIMDARRGEVYNGVYKYSDGGIVTIKDARALPLLQLLDEFKGENVIFVGDAVPPYRDVIIEKMGKRAAFAPEHLVLQRAGSVAKAAQNLPLIPAQELVPVYIRKPQAERELEEKMKNQDKE